MIMVQIGKFVEPPSIKKINTKERATVMIESPTRSSSFLIFGFTLGIKRIDRGIANAPTNKLTKKTKRQPKLPPKPTIMTPPITGPDADDIPIMVPRIPNARDLAFPAKRSEIVAWMEGPKRPADAPCTIRAITSSEAFIDEPQITDEMAKSESPVTNRGLWP